MYRNISSALFLVATVALLGSCTATVASDDSNEMWSQIANLQKRVPKGVIVMWSGTEIPPGWVLCDGKPGTPDLRSRFVVGAGKGSEYAIGNTGGAAAVKLTLEQMPKHSHSYGDTVYRENNQSVNQKDIPAGYAVRNVPAGIGSHATDGDNDREVYTTRQTSEEGGNLPQENRPPYYALAFIMKL